jgi:hypothetical protein
MAGHSSREVFHFYHCREDTTGVTSTLYKSKVASELIHVEAELKRFGSFLCRRLAGFKLKDVDVHTRKFIHDSQFVKVFHEYYALPFGWNLHLYFRSAEFTRIQRVSAKSQQGSSSDNQFGKVKRMESTLTLMSITHLRFLRWKKFGQY